jgi:uncharacterized pyridoxamine 5'-phosphate oxidase family protein
VIEHILHVWFHGTSYFIKFNNQTDSIDFSSSDLSKITIKGVKDLYSWVEFKGEFMKDDNLYTHKKVFNKLLNLGYPKNIEFEVFVIKNGSGIEHREDGHFVI